MKKIGLVFLVLLLPNTCFAQILNLLGTKEKLAVPVEFLVNMADCEPYETKVVSAPEGIKTETIYKVLGMKKGKCDFQIEGLTNSVVHITQKCSLTLEQADKYAEAIYNFQNKEYSSYKLRKQIYEDTDYIAASEIMTDEKLCRFHRDAIDQTADWRQNLQTCSPFKDSSQLNSVAVTRQVIGLVNDKCLFKVTFTQKLPDMKRRPEKFSLRVQHLIDNFNEADYQYVCEFNDEIKNEYIKLLETMVIPAEDGFDFSAVQRFTMLPEMEFIAQNCTYNAQKK